jgi:hypothetical protein
MESFTFPEKWLLGYRTMNTKYDYGMMSILKENTNAPILGCFDMEPDFKNYEWKQEHIPGEEFPMIKITWTKKKNVDDAPF